MRGFMTVRLGPEDLTNFFDFFPITQRGLQSKKIILRDVGLL